jgi:putative ABC transport system substrate-binding protein
MFEVAPRMGMKITDKSFGTREELNDFMLSYDFSKIDAVFRYPGSFIASNLDLLFAFRAMNKKPIIGLNRLELEKGAVLSYGPDYAELGGEAAGAAYEILFHRVDPAEIPVKRPSHLILGLNIGVMAELGVVPSSDFSSGVDYVVK